MPDIGRDHNGITLPQLSFLITSDSVSNPAVNHHQRLRAIRVVMPAVRMAWLQDAAANGHLVAIAKRPIGEPGEVAPVKFLPLRFGVGEDFNISGHWNRFFLMERSEGNEGKKQEDSGSKSALGSKDSLARLRISEKVTRRI